MKNFVKMPIGLIMHSSNHRALVDQAKKHGLKGMLAMLVPAEPFDPAVLLRLVIRRDVDD